MASADLLVHFSNCRLENFGLVVGEAMAAGLPVVAADWGGLRDLVVPGTTGILAPTFLSSLGPRTDWLSAVAPAADLLEDSGIWETMSRNSRCRALELLSPAVHRRNLRVAVEEAVSVAEDDRPPRLSPAGTELMFRTLTLHARDPDLISTGEEYRRLMPLDGGSHYRFLTGPAASLETTPVVHD